MKIRENLTLRDSNFVNKISLKVKFDSNLKISEIQRKIFGNFHSNETNCREDPKALVCLYQF